MHLCAVVLNIHNISIKFLKGHHKMLKDLKKKTDGFTIIEVLIVLAIAGLILLVVFLAVPSLQRNSRNSQYRGEASKLLGAYQEVQNNKGGAVLAASLSTTGGSDAQKVYQASNSKNITTLFIQAHTTGANISAIAATGTPTVNEVNVSKAIIRTGAKCAGPTDGNATAGSTRQIAMYYVVETANGQELQCQES